MDLRGSGFNLRGLRLDHKGLGVELDIRGSRADLMELDVREIKVVAGPDGVEVEPEGFRGQVEPDEVGVGLEGVGVGPEGVEGTA